MPRPVATVLDRYRDLRHRVDEEKQETGRWKYWQHASATAGNKQISRWKAPASGRGTLLLRDMLREEIGDDAVLREMLLLEAARRGCLYLVRELLCPTPPDFDEGKVIDEQLKCPPPVSINVLDGGKNHVLHLAVKSGNAPLVRWLLRHSKTCLESKRTNYWEWNSALNDESESPLTLAIALGRTRVLSPFLKSVEQFYVLPGASMCRFSLPYAIQRMNRLDGAKEMSAFLQGNIYDSSFLQELSSTIKGLRLESEGGENAKFYIISFTAFLGARLQASQHVRDALDRWMRYHHIKNMTMGTDDELLSLARLKETLGGMFCPWWNTMESDFDLGDYIQNRGETEQRYLFNLLCSSVKAGHYDSAIWLLKTFKAPPSMRAYRSDSDRLDGFWYLNNADKIAEEAVFGWVDSIVAEILESSGDTRSLYRPSSKIVERKMLPFGKEYACLYKYNIFAEQMPERIIRFNPKENCSLRDFWGDVWRKVKGTPQNSDEEKLFGVEVKVYVAAMLSGRHSLASFEESGHGKLVSYFFETAYSEETGFTAADLPRLSCFVALDLLVFFQFLIKTRKTSNSGKEYSYLDLNIPLLFPPASELQIDAEDDDEMDLDEDDDECVICLESISDPYTLSCGHRFHQQCLFRYTFPEVREAEEDELDENSSQDERAELAHQVLAEHDDLSFILGFCTCPYCRAKVKPSLPRAFALNIADGLWRTASHRRYAPSSPNLDISECRPGTTVGEALLGFSACCGAINIFEWLVNVKKVDPESFKARDGINILYVALSHGQLLIVRWLCENGYSHLLLGGLDRDQFDDDSSIRHLNTALNENQAARIDFMETEVDLSNRRCDYRKVHEYTKEEKRIIDDLEDGLTEEEENITYVRADVRRMSPIHMLLLSGRDKSSSSNCEGAFDYLWAIKKLEGVLPKSWCRLVLTTSTNDQLRKEAKRFLAYQIIRRPKDLDAEALKLQVEENATGFANGADITNTSLKDVLECHLGDISLLDIEKNTQSFNFWHMFASGIKDWKQYARIASSVNLFVTSSSIKLFDDDPYVREEIISFLQEVVIQGGCINLLVSFCQMESFEHIFDLNSETDCKYSSFSGKSLRKMIKGQNRWDSFSLLFDTLENTDVASRKVLRASSTALKAVSQGKSLEELQEMTEEVRRLVSSIPNCERPFGRCEDFSRFADPAQWDWLSGRIEIHGEYKDIICILLDRQDATIMNWALSFLLKQWKLEGSYDETIVVLQYIRAITTCSSKNLQFGLETIIKYLTEVDRSSKYFGNCDELLLDLLGIGSQEKEEEDFSKAFLFDDNDASSRNRLREGLIMQIMSKIFDKCRYFTLGSREETKRLTELVKADPREVVAIIRETIKPKYRAIEWFFTRPDVRKLLMSQDNIGLCSKHLLSSKDLVDVSVAPHISFRIMNLFFSNGLNPMVEIPEDGTSLNLVEHVLKQYRHMHTSASDDLFEVMRIWAEDDEYKTANGQIVDSAQVFVHWLVIEIGIDIQHIHFNDINYDSFYDKNVFSL